MQGKDLALMFVLEGDKGPQSRAFGCILPCTVLVRSNTAEVIDQHAVCALHNSQQGTRGMPGQQANWERPW